MASMILRRVFEVRIPFSRGWNFPKNCLRRGIPVRAPLLQLFVSSGFASFDCLVALICRIHVSESEPADGLGVASASFVLPGRFPAVPLHHASSDHLPWVTHSAIQAIPAIAIVICIVETGLRSSMVPPSVFGSAVHVDLRNPLESTAPVAGSDLWVTHRCSNQWLAWTGTFQARRLDRIRQAPSWWTRGMMPCRRVPWTCLDIVASVVSPPTIRTMEWVRGWCWFGQRHGRSFVFPTFLPADGSIPSFRSVSFHTPICPPMRRHAFPIDPRPRPWSW